MPWVLRLFAILVLLGGGGATAAYFLLVKPWLEQQRGGVVVDDKRPVTNENANRNANTSSNPTPGPSAVVKEEPPEFVPPPNAVKFANSRTGLDSKLEEHYIDFSFYYPSAWKKDPKAGAAGNFARIDRSLTEDSIDYPQEKVAVSWYLSNGSFDADKAIFPDRVKDLSAQMAKGLPGFSKTTEGETKVNSLNAYEFRFTGAYTGTKKGDIPYWGRVIFVSPRGENEKNGVTIIMLATKLAPGVAGVDDVGVKGELPMILDSFRFGAK